METERILVIVSFAAVIALVMSGISVAQPIGDWDGNLNGWPVNLNIASVDSEGRLAGSITDGGVTHSIVGSWDEDQKKIVFMRIRDPQNAAISQLFTGYYFQYPRTPGGGDNVDQYLTGYFQEATGYVGGWFAHRNMVT